MINTVGLLLQGYKTYVTFEFFPFEVLEFVKLIKEEK